MTSADDNLDIAVLEVVGPPLPDDIKPLPTSSNPIQRQMSVRAIGYPVRGLPWSIEPGTIDLLQKSKTHPPQSPRGFGGKQEKLGSLPLVRGGLGRGLSIFARGLISSYNSQQFQISGTTIQAGNSGGPVINSENQLLGIVVEVDGGLGFAYPMPVIMEKLRALGIK